MFTAARDPLIRNPSAADDEPVPDGNVIGASHAKFTAIDQQIAIFGSANMDKTSWHFAGEANVAVFDPEAAQSIIAQVFDPAWHKSEVIYNNPPQPA